MTPETLEYEIRKLDGVIACSITATAIAVLAGPAADATAIGEHAGVLAGLAGVTLPVQVIGGTTAAVGGGLARLRAPVAVGATVGTGVLLAAAVATAVTGGITWVPGVSSNSATSNAGRPAALAPARPDAATRTPFAADQPYIRRPVQPAVGSLGPLPAVAAPTPAPPTNPVTVASIPAAVPPHPSVTDVGPVSLVLTAHVVPGPIADTTAPAPVAAPVVAPVDDSPLGPTLPVVPETPPATVPADRLPLVPSATTVPVPTRTPVVTPGVIVGFSGPPATSTVTTVKPRPPAKATAAVTTVVTPDLAALRGAAQALETEAHQLAVQADQVLHQVHDAKKAMHNLSDEARHAAEENAEEAEKAAQQAKHIADHVSHEAGHAVHQLDQLAADAARDQQQAATKAAHDAAHAAAHAPTHGSH